MDNLYFDIYCDMLDGAGLESYQTYEDDVYYVYSEDKYTGEIVLASFDINGDMINLTTDVSINSLDEVRYK